MTHGRFHNQDCKYCRMMDKVTWILAATILIGVEISLWRSRVLTKDGANLMVALPIAYALALYLWRYVRQALPQTHGMLADMTGDTDWYAPKKN